MFPENWHFNPYFVLKTTKKPVFGFITESLWRTFWRNKWRLFLALLKDSALVCLIFLFIIFWKVSLRTKSLNKCPSKHNVKVHIYWEGHKSLQKLHRRFDRYYIGQIYDGDFAKFCGFLRIYEPYRISGYSCCRSYSF